MGSERQTRRCEFSLIALYASLSLCGKEYTHSPPELLGTRVQVSAIWTVNVGVLIISFSLVSKMIWGASQALVNLGIWTKWLYFAFELWTEPH